MRHTRCLWTFWGEGLFSFPLRLPPAANARCAEAWIFPCGSRHPRAGPGYNLRPRSKGPRERSEKLRKFASHFLRAPGTLKSPRQEDSRRCAGQVQTGSQFRTHSFGGSSGAVCSKGNIGTVAAMENYRSVPSPPSGAPQTRPERCPAPGPFFLSFLLALVRV
jgi:hypothetical protein